MKITYLFKDKKTGTWLAQISPYETLEEADRTAAEVSAEFDDREEARQWLKNNRSSGSSGLNLTNK